MHDGLKMLSFYESLFHMTMKKNKILGFVKAPNYEQGSIIRKVNVKPVSPKTFVMNRDGSLTLLTDSKNDPWDHK